MAFETEKTRVAREDARGAVDGTAGGSVSSMAENLADDAAERAAGDASCGELPGSGRRGRGSAAGAHGLSRREFVAAGAACAALAGLGGAGVFVKQGNAVFLRPPGAASEDDLLSRCNRCQRCVQACPYSIVQPLPLTAAFLTQGTPALVFKTGFCDFCMKCVEACPTGALRKGTPTYDDIGVAKVVEDACVAWDWAGCTVCVDECPVEGAIMLDDHGRPVVDEALCDGCGKCELKCPAASLRAYDSAVAEKGIYVVSRACALASHPGACTSEELAAARGVAAEKEARHV